MNPPSVKPDATSSDETSAGPVAAPVAAEAKPGKVENLREHARKRPGALKMRVGAGDATAPKFANRQAGQASRTGRTWSGPAGQGNGGGAGNGTGQGRFAAARAAKAEAAKAVTTEAVVADPLLLTGAVSPGAQAAPAPKVASVAQAPVVPPVAGTLMPEDDDSDPRGPVQAPRRQKAGGMAQKRGGAAARPGKLDLSDYVVAPTVNPARLRRRHYGVIALFVIMVILPTAVYSWYLWARAADQYESDVGFASRTEDAASPFAFLGVLGGSSTSGANDMDILNQFIISQELVTRVDKKLDLRALFSKPKNDPLKSFDTSGTVEDLVDFWRRMVVVNYDTTTGLMNLQVFAFDPQDAQAIAQVVLDESTKIINDLSITAQDDATKYSKESLQTSEERLAKTNLKLTDFRIKNNIVDPSAVLASQSTVVGTLTQQLASAQIDLDMLTGSVPDTDPRIAQLNKRLDVIRNRIAQEAAKVGGVADSTAAGYATLVADYQRLLMDQDFASKAYLASQAAYDQAVTNAQHKSAYLATFVSPTLAEASTAPNRPLTAFLTALIGFLLWSVTVLVYYALRDRR